MERSSFDCGVDMPSISSRTPSLHLDSSLHLSQQAATPSSPMSPAVSVKGHSRFPSACSNLGSSPPVRASMDSYLSKRPLTQLKEYPEEKDLDMHRPPSEQLQFSGLSDQFPPFPRAGRYVPPQDLPVDYDWVETSPYEGSEHSISVPKRRRAENFTPSAISNKVVSRFPNISRRLRSISLEKRSSSIIDPIPVTRSQSRASSMRSVVTRDSGVDAGELRENFTMPTPATSFIQEEPVEEPVDLAAGLGDSEDEIEAPPRAMARTPLLPPVLDLQTQPDDEIQSPLQSPKVVEAMTSPSSPHDSPDYPGLPSPPLSNRPSIASFHHRPIIPSSEIPAIALNEPQDEWAVRLGHANFTILPEPYRPEEPTLEACRRLKADWEEAEREFGRHLARTRANYSATSKIAHLTEVKWAGINGLWKTCHEEALAAAQAAFSSLEDEGSLELVMQSSLRDPVPVTRIPSHLGCGKFPSFGDRGIVGPMEVAKPLAPRPEKRQSFHQRSFSRGSNRKRNFWKFLQDLLPGSLVRPQA